MRCDGLNAGQVSFTNYSSPIDRNLFTTHHMSESQVSPGQYLTSELSGTKLGYRALFFKAFPTYD